MKLKNTKVATLAATLIAFSLLTGGANATTVFTFDAADNGLPTITRTVDGITLTLSSPSEGSFRADLDGLSIAGRRSGLNTASFTMQFSHTVQLISYEFGFVGTSNDGDTWTLGQGGDTTTESDPFAIGSRDFATQFTAAANLDISSTATFGTNNTGLLQIRSITVNQIPEPSSAVLLGLGALGFVTRRRRI